MIPGPYFRHTKSNSLDDDTQKSTFFTSVLSDVCVCVEVEESLPYKIG